MKYGLAGKYGTASEYGIDSGTFDELWCEQAVDRLLVQDREGPNITALVCDLVVRWAFIANVAEDIKASFDLDTAVGDQLDKIGSRVYLPRLGWTDDRYRTLLKIQVDHVRFSDGAGETLLGIAREFVGAGPTITYDEQEHYPAAFVLGIGLLSPGDANDLLPFIRAAKTGGVLFHLYGDPDNALIVDDTTTPITDPGVVDDTQTPIVGAGVVAVVYE